MHTHTAPNECTSSQFTCTNGECVSQDDVCNFRVDCSDESDERLVCSTDELSPAEAGTT